MERTVWREGRVEIFEKEESKEQIDETNKKDGGQFMWKGRKINEEKIDRGYREEQKRTKIRNCEELHLYSLIQVRINTNEYR